MTRQDNRPFEDRAYDFMDAAGRLAQKYRVSLEAVQEGVTDVYTVAVKDGKSEESLPYMPCI